MTIEERVDKLEKRFEESEKVLNKTLTEIKNDLIEIKGCVQRTDDTGDLKNKLIEKDIDSLNERVEKTEEKIKEQEESKKWLVRLVIGSIIGLALEALALYLKMKP